MTDMFLEPIIEMLISAGSRYLKDQVTWHKRTKEELEKLKGKLPQIQAVVHFASSQDQITDQNRALNTWLWQLRDAIDDAKDVLDELEYMELEKQVTKNKKLRRVRSIFKFMKKKVVKIGKRVLKIDRTLKRLEEAVQKLDQVSTTGVDTLLHLVKYERQELKQHGERETGSSPQNDLIGRGKEMELVMGWLRNSSNDYQTTMYGNISLLSIVGHGGMGKTTLLQHVYKDEIIREFDPPMWVCVSNNFDVKEVIADMLELLTKERPRLKKLEALQDSLRTEIMSKKFLLVLDDVWDEEEERDKSKWGNVLAPLASGGFGSKILVTTRTDAVVLMFARVIRKKVEIVQLKGLEEEECLQLLNSHAFAGVEDPDNHENLRVISRDIVKKLLRSPLAAKVIGRVLNDKLDERHWRTVLESNLLGENSIKSILTLSYIVLQNHLQNCFAICCMFPQDHTFDKDDLVRMWIALGFIQPSQGKTMEDIGGRYFDVLVKKALFDKVEDDYKMHDLIHESASEFFAQECGKLVDDKESSLKISETIRHLFVRTTNPDILRQIEKFKHLHSLFLFYEDSNLDEDFNQDLCNRALIEIFQASRSLRLLYVHSFFLERIPKEIGNLIHLRYLNIKCHGPTELPRSLSNLYHLQYIFCAGLSTGHKSEDAFLPSDINNFSNLCYVKLPDNYISSICGIGRKLKTFSELNEFVPRDVSGYRIGELENMNDLCKLEIYNLENVKDAVEACSAKLCEKRRLTDLTLCWSDTYLMGSSVDLNENVLDNLLPPECLMNLSIKHYIGARSPIWMNNVNPISNLEKIKLENCWKWETLPPFGQLRYLKSLTLTNMSKVKWLESKFNGNDKYRAFPLLEVLHIRYLKALEDWFEAGVAAEDGCLFPSLIELVLFGVPKLKELPSLPSKLKSLQIDGIGWKTLNFCSISNSIPLETLEVSHCPNITSLPLADEIARLAALRSLTISKCPNLTSLGEMQTTNNCPLILNNLEISDPSVLLMEPLRSIASLKELSIEYNDELVSFPNEAEQWFLNVRSSLSELRFFSLKSLESLPSSLESLSSLLELRIQGVSMLRELPNLPPSLESLYIWGPQHRELKKRYREGGSDHHKIAHIPRIHFWNPF